jgi:hypothetical protein
MILLRRFFFLFVCLVALYGSILAQTPKTITVRMVDTRSGVVIATSNYLVRVNHQETEHGDWITKNEDGTGKLIYLQKPKSSPFTPPMKLPRGSTSIAIPTRSMAQPNTPPRRITGTPLPTFSRPASLHPTNAWAKKSLKSFRSSPGQGNLFSLSAHAIRVSNSAINHSCGGDALRRQTT